MVGRASRAAPLYDEALAQPPDSEAAGRNATAAHGIMVRSILTVTSGVSAAVSVAALAEPAAVVALAAATGFAEPATTLAQPAAALAPPAVAIAAASVAEPIN